MKMQKEKINYAFLVRIHPKRDNDTHDPSYTAFWRVIKYNRETGKPFLHHEDSDHRTYLEDRDLFSDVTYRSRYDGREYTDDYTDTKWYPLQAGEVFDSPDGINICAKHNITFYQEARNRWNELNEQAREGPVRSGLKKLIDYHERLVGDCEKWLREKFPDHLKQLMKEGQTVESRMDNTRISELTHEPSDLGKRYRQRRTIAQFPVAQDTQWHEVKFTLLGSDKIKITVRGKSKVFRLDEIGFAGRSPKKTGSLWDLLLFLATYDRVIDSKIGERVPGRTALKSKIKNLRKLLKYILSIDEDPIPYIGSKYGGEYRARFEVSHTFHDPSSDRYRDYDDEEN